MTMTAPQEGPRPTPLGNRRQAECLLGIIGCEGSGAELQALLERGLGAEPNTEIAAGDAWALGVRRVPHGAAGTGLASCREGALCVGFVGELFDPEAAAEGGALEAVAAVYESRGVRPLGELNGHFAAAVWDAQVRKLVLLVDWVGGVRSLYYAVLPEGIAFATRLEPLLRLLPQRRVNEEALFELLTFGRVLPPATMLADVRRVTPGEIVIWEAGRITSEPGWHLRAPAQPEPASSARFLGLYDDAVRRRLETAERWGAFLSGGLDSSLNVATIHELVGPGFPTFSVAYPGYEEDESAYSRLVAEQFGTEHHELSLTSAQYLQRLPDMVWATEEPHSDSSFIPTYLLTEAMGDQVAVGIGGDGPDHILGRIFDKASFRSTGRVVPGGWLSALALGPFAPPEGRRVAFWQQLLQSGRGSRVWNRLAAAAGSVEQAYLRTVCARSVWQRLAPTTAYELLSEDLRRRVALPADWVWEPARSLGRPFEQMTALDTLLDGSMGVFVKVGKAAETHGLVLREPYLDRQVAEYVAGLPASWKVAATFREALQGKGRRKHILRLAAKSRVPEAVLTKPKQGFAAPVKEWMNELTEGVEPRQVLGSLAQHTDWLNWSLVERLFASQRAGRRHDRILFLLACLDLWHRIYVVGDGRPLQAGWGELF